MRTPASVTAEACRRAYRGRRKQGHLPSLPRRDRSAGGDRVAAALESRRRVPELNVLVLSQYVEQTYAAELLADGRGGIGYLLKERVADTGDFVAAVRRVAEGGTALDPEVVRQLVARRGPLAELTPREREVLELMAEGKSNAGIAAQLVVTESAVEKHVRSVFQKLRLPRRTRRTVACSRCSPTCAPQARAYASATTSGRISHAPTVSRMPISANWRL